MVVPMAVGPTILPISDSLSDSAFSGNISLGYNIIDDIKVYGVYRRGFKAGGFNSNFLTSSVGDLKFEKETVDQLEIGLKTKFWNNRIMLNTAAFYMSYIDKQEAIDEGVNLMVRNSGEATIKGAEVELAVRLHPKLQINGSIGVLDTVYDSFKDAGSMDAIGNNLANAPELTASFGGTFIQPLSDVAFLSIGGNVSYQDDSFSNPANTLIKESATIVNARVCIETADGKWSVAVWGKNIFDSFTEEQPDSFLGTDTVFMSSPRTFGIEVKMLL